MVDLYKHAVDCLSLKYNNDKDSAHRKTIVLVTHLDMIPPSIREDFSKGITCRARKAGISINYLFLVEKECTWKEEILHQFEDRFLKALEKVPPGKDYWDYLPDEEGFLHVSPEQCTRPKCEHNFTPNSMESFSKILDLFQTKQ